MTTPAAGTTREAGDVKSPHIYFVRVKLTEDKERAVVLSEFGGYSYKEKGHVFNREKVFGYRVFKNREGFVKAYTKLFEEQIIPLIEKGLSATVYTQLSDVEDEIKGLLTYDREILKIPASELTPLNKKIKV